MLNLILNQTKQIGPYLPKFAYDFKANYQLFTAFLCCIAFVGLSILIANILSSVMKNKGFICKKPLVISIAGIFSLALFLRFGFSLLAIKGVFLLMLLTYASCSDITLHKVDDCIFVCILALSICNIKDNFLSMLLGALMVFLPQIIMIFLPKIKILGGADIKISTSIAFLMGAIKGMAAYILGLIFAVIFMCIYNRVKDRSNQRPFALIPFLSASTMLVYLI